MTVQLGDYDFKVVVNVKNSDGSARNLTGATSLQIKLRVADTPDIVRTFTGVAENLAQGQISYTVEQGVIDALGQWEAQATWTLSAVPGHTEWEDAFEVEGESSSELNIVQLFCTVADLVADKDSPGLNESRMFQAIRDASDFLQKEIGWFLPVTRTRYFSAPQESKRLFIGPLLAISAISNDATTLTEADYLLKPDDGFWANGPYPLILVDPYATSLPYWSRIRNGVIITGRWGKYEKIGLLDATVAALQTDSQTTLQVSNGGAVSPGMVLSIGSEQQAVIGWSTPTANVTALNGAISASDEILTVDNGALVNIGEVLRLQFEQMKVQDKRGHQLSVIRNWNGTGKVGHADDTSVDVYRTVIVERHVNGSIAAAHAAAAPLARYLVPDDILYLTKEIATLSANKALGGYQGRTGNQETGVVFYNDAFPQFDIEKIKSNYHIPRSL